MAITGVSNIERLSNIISRDLGLTNGKLAKEIDTSSKRIARKGARILKTRSPNRKGDYSEGWTASKVRGNWVIHNKDRYQLTHLLEDGHKGGFGSDPVPAYPHIRQAEDLVIEEFINELERLVRDG